MKWSTAVLRITGLYALRRLTAAWPTVLLGHSLRSFPRKTSGTFFCALEMLRISFIGRKKTSHTTGTLCEMPTQNIKNLLTKIKNQNIIYNKEKRMVMFRKFLIFLALFFVITRFNVFCMGGIDVYTSAGFQEAVSHTTLNNVKVGEVYAKIGEISSLVTGNPRNRMNTLTCTSGIISEVTLETIYDSGQGLLLTLKEEGVIYTSMSIPNVVRPNNLRKGSKIWIVWRLQADMDGEITKQTEKFVSDDVKKVIDTKKNIDGESLSNEEYNMLLGFYEWYSRFIPIDNNLFPCIWYIFSDKNEAVNWLKANPNKQELTL